MWLLIFILVPLIIYILRFRKSKFNVSYKMLLLEQNLIIKDYLCILADILIISGVVIRVSRLKHSFGLAILATIIIGFIMIIMVKTLVYLILKYCI